MRRGGRELGIRNVFVWWFAGLATLGHQEGDGGRDCELRWDMDMANMAMADEWTKKNVKHSIASQKDDISLTPSISCRLARTNSISIRPSLRLSVIPLCGFSYSLW